MGKYVKKLTNEELLERLADELVDMHEETGIDLAYWETACEIVQRYYAVNIVTVIGKKKEKK